MHRTERIKIGGRAARALLIAGTSFAVNATFSTTASAQSGPEVIGEWSDVFDLGHPQGDPPLVTAVHAVLTKDGDVLAWHGSNGVLLATMTGSGFAFTHVPHEGINYRCAGHAAFSDGRILVMGGQDSAVDGPFINAGIFDPDADPSQAWTGVLDMWYERFYPTATKLPDLHVQDDDQILVIRGTQLKSSNNEPVPFPEVWRVKHGDWHLLDNEEAEVDEQWGMDEVYPFMFVEPHDGTGDTRVLWAGPLVYETDFYLRYFNLDDGPQGLGNPFWEDLIESFEIMDGRSAAMFDAGQIIQVGWIGDESYSSTIDLNDSAPAWGGFKLLNLDRHHLDTVVLPNGYALVLGGTLCGVSDIPGDKFAEWINPADPQSTWTELAEPAKFREGHSAALLLPDATVFFAGGRTILCTAQSEQVDAEIFYPPYLFQGERPVIGMAPSSVTYDSQFTIKLGSSGSEPSPEAEDIDQVVLIRPGAVTHSFDQEQRRVALDFEVSTMQLNALTVDAPPNATHAPPGYYMLFIVTDEGDGVPSVAKFIRLEHPSQ